MEAVSPSPVIIHPHQDASADWLPNQLQQASEVWVTEDSVSMIFEALSSGAAVGLLPMKRLKENGKIQQTIKRLIDSNSLTTYSSWLAQRKLSPAPTILNEADRCAKIITQKIFPHLL
jgi:mitochondrial fission protein ELM1